MPDLETLLTRYPSLLEARADVFSFWTENRRLAAGMTFTEWLTDDCTFADVEPNQNQAWGFGYLSAVTQALNVTLGELFIATGELAREPV